MEFNILMFIRNHLSNDFLDWFMTFVSALGDAGFIWILLGVFMVCYKPTRKCGVFLLFSITLGYLIGNLTIKNIIARTRPYIEYNIPIIIPNPSEYSFPSGHTLSSFIGALSIFKFNKFYGKLALILAILIAFSRMYLFVHYPTDIIGGIILAFFIIFLSSKIFKYISTKKESKR